MKFRKNGLFGLIWALALTLAAGTGLAEDQASYSNKWRIEVSKSSDSAGTIAFRLTPKDGTSTEVSVEIPEGRGENQIAQDIRDALRKGLDAKVFHVEVDDGEDVLVKRKHGNPDFSLELVQSSVTGTRLKIEKE